MTNADCIRRMTDEQLYDFLSEWECGDIDYSITFCDLCKQGGNELNLDCDGCRKHWLQRDAVDFGGLLYWKRNTTFTADTPQTETQTKTQNSNLTFEKDECAKEYEELGLKELKELIEADRKTEPKCGEWIAKTENCHSHWVCSKCGAWALLEYNEQMCLSNFCPNCGADMRKE